METRVSPLRWLPFPVGVAVVAAAATTFVVWTGLRGDGFPLDDSWIHQVFARNLALHGSWGFPTGEHSAGTSGILWTLILAANYSLFGLAPSTYTALVNVLMMAGCCGAFYGLLRGDGMDRPAAAALALLPPLLGNTSWLAASGFESLLIVFWSITAVALWRMESPWTGLVVALAVMTRPECLGLPIVLTGAWWMEGRAKPQRLWWIWLPATAGLGATVWVSWLTSDGLLPATLAGRRWLYGFDGPMVLRVVVMFATWTSQIVEKALGWSLWWAPLPLAAIGTGLWRARRYPGLATLAAFALAVTGLYVVILTNIGHGGRYQPLNLFLAPPLAGLGLAVWSERFAKRFPRALVPAAASIVAIACLPSMLMWRNVVDQGIDHINSAHVRFAHMVKQRVPPDAVVAAYDIGAIGYFSERRVVDLGGLVDREFLPYLVEGRVPEYLEEHEIDLVALPEGFEGGEGIGSRLGLVGNPALDLQRIAGAQADREPWRGVFWCTGSASPRLTLYRIQRSR